MATPTRRAIQKLDDATVAEIAAGEVVERPASVVKELYENAVDAGATEVQIRLRAGGLELIEVADDGVGIPEEELPLAVERYATSKLTRAAELSSLQTLGFRGEALAAIGAVSRLRIISRVSTASAGHGISIVAGSLVGRFLVGRAPGTTVEVLDLFFNVPARRKFLHAAAAEQLEVVSTVDRLYLAQPRVGVTLISEDRELARYPPAADLRDAAGRVFGPEFLSESFSAAAEGPAGNRVIAILSRPSLSRASPSDLVVAINGRPVTDRNAVNALRAAYVDYLPRGRFPLGVAHLWVPPESLDVNVHPTKREVRRIHGRELDDLLRRAVRGALRGGRQTAHPPDLRISVRDSPARPPRLSAPEAPSPAPEISAPPPPPLTAQRRIDSDPAPTSVEATARHPRLRLLGCLFSLYWLAEAPDGLVIVDQHAASERLVYDALRTSGRLQRQELLQPYRVQLTPRQAAAWKASGSLLQQVGFDAEPFGGEEWRVVSVPSYRGTSAHPSELPRLLDELATGAEGRTSTDEWVERRTALIACHAAVRAGDVLSPEQMGRILEALYHGPQEAYACPHGRPILLGFSRSRLDQLFLRSGP